MSKLKNIEALQKMLAGEHRAQTKKVFGYEAKKDTSTRRVGEIWEETLPSGMVIEWEQKQGYKIRRVKGGKKIFELLDSIEKFPNCLHGKCNKNPLGHADKILQKKVGMCTHCSTEYEGKLKMEGNFEEWAKNKRKENIRSFLKDAEKEVDKIIEGFNDLTFVNVDGANEHWEFENKEGFIKKIRSDFQKLKEDLLKD